MPTAVLLTACWTANRNDSLIGNGRRCSVDLAKANRELFVISQRSVLKDADCQGLAQLYGCVGVAAPMDPRVNAVTEGDVVCELVQLAADTDQSRVSSRVWKE